MRGAEGDDEGLGDMIYNRKQVRALRIHHAALGGAPVEPPAALLGVDSIGNFDEALDGSARADLTPLLRTLLLTA
jgi:hypothetical protein